MEIFGRYDKAFSTLLGPENFIYKPFFVVDNEFPESINEADAWLLTGSKHGAYEPLDWIQPLERLIQHIYAEGLPMVGICFGHQIMAQALGGKVAKYEGGWIVGTQKYKFDKGVGVEDVVLNAWHQDQVIEPPTNATVIGSSDTCTFAGLSYRSNTVSLQPHPEFNNEYLAKLLSERGSTLSEHTFKHANDSLGQVLTNAAIAVWLRRTLSSPDSQIKRL